MGVGFKLAIWATERGVMVHVVVITILLIVVLFVLLHLVESGKLKKMNLKMFKLRNLWGRK